MSRITSKRFAAPLALAALAALAVPASAIEASLQITIPGPVQHMVSTYDCGADTDPIRVDYVNGEAGYLAIVPVDGTPRLFVNVISGSGARYASGGHIWWSRGAEAFFYDEMGDDPDTPLLECIEMNDTP